MGLGQETEQAFKSLRLVWGLGFGLGFRVWGNRVFPFRVWACKGLRVKSLKLPNWLRKANGGVVGLHAAV